MYFASKYIIQDKHGELLIRKDLLDINITRKNVNVFWGVVGEKQYFLGNDGQKWQRREGYYIYDSNKIDGTIQIVPN